MPSLAELVAAVRSDLDESTEAYWDDDEIVRWINRGKDYIWQKAVETDEDYGLTFYDFSIVADTDAYAIQNDVYRVRRIERIWPNDTGRTPIAWYPISLHEKGRYDIRPNSDGADNESGYRYLLRANQFQVVPIPNSAVAGTSNGRVWYIPKLGELHSGTASAGATSSITFPSTATLPAAAGAGATVSRIDDYYIGLDILITGGTGVGQIRRISDYAGSTRVATVHSAWDTTPSTDSTYSLMIPVPDAYQYLAAMYANIRAFLKDEADKRQMQEEFDRLLAQFIQSISHRQTQESRSVNYTDDDRAVGY